MAEGQSPAEELLDAIDPPEEEGDVDPLRPWEPKGLTQTQPQVTVEGVALVGSPPPPITAGGAGPSNKRPMGKYGPEGS